VRASVAGMSGSAFLPERKFSALQGLENSQNAEGILILCEPVRGPAERPAPRMKARRAIGAAHDPRVLDPARASTTVDGGLGRDR
jgi:hypothetical protein